MGVMETMRGRPVEESKWVRLGGVVDEESGEEEERAEVVQK